MGSMQGHTLCRKELKGDSTQCQCLPWTFLLDVDSLFLGCSVSAQLWDSFSADYGRTWVENECQVDHGDRWKRCILGLGQCLHKDVWVFLKMNEDMDCGGLTLRGR